MDDIAAHHPVSRTISKPKMKLLVLAQTPPPIHGQSIMVRTLVEGLPSHGIPLHHVNLPLSSTAADIGRWRFGKIVSVLSACIHAVAARFIHGCDTLYYVPAPAKRGALYRDWAVMLFCRPFFRHTVLHWHAVGLGEWVNTKASLIERWITKLLLGRVSLSIVLSESLRFDAAVLNPKKIAVIANGVPAPESAHVAPEATTLPQQILFLGLCSEEKGLFATAHAIIAANQALSASPENPAFTLVAAGPFPDEATANRFATLAKQHPTQIRHVGSVQGAEKAALFATSHAFCLPTRYPAEGQPLVLLEAMAHDLPIIATRWRGIAEAVPPAALLVEPGDDVSLLHALMHLRQHPPAKGAFRAHYLAHFTVEHHLGAVDNALTDMVL
jgi:glycosyltransferase involved in cell wall biosynthesis